MLLPLCRYGSAATAPLLELLAVALTAHNPLLAIVFAVTATPLDIGAALILLIPAELWLVLFWMCIHQHVLNVFRSLSFSTSTRMNVPACICRRVLVSNLNCISLHVRVTHPSRSCVQHLDRCPGRPAPAQDCLCIFDVANSTNPIVESSLSKVFLSIAFVKMSLTCLLSVISWSRNSLLQSCLGSTSNAFEHVVACLILVDLHMI